MVSLELLPSLLLYFHLRIFSSPSFMIFYTQSQKTKGTECKIFARFISCVSKENLVTSEKEPRMRLGNLGESYCSHVYADMKNSFFYCTLCPCHLWSRSFCFHQRKNIILCQYILLLDGREKCKPLDIRLLSTLSLKITAHSANCLISKGFSVTYKLQHNIMCQLSCQRNSH